MTTKQRQNITARVEEVLGASDPAKTRSIVTDLLYAGEPEMVMADDALIEKLGKKYEERLAGRKKVGAEDATVCPICKCPLSPVKLTADRKAMFCKKHFIVFPTKSDKTEKPAT